MKWSDLMIDLETLGTGPDAVIVSIGAVFFDIEKGTLGPTFEMVLDIQSEMGLGRKIDADTLRWWFSQENAAKKVFHEKATDPVKVLELFSYFCQTNSTPKMLKAWGNGSTFDITLMESLYKTYARVHPWGYNGVMDLRTFRRFVADGAPVIKTGTNHNALDDAISQAKFVLEYYKRSQDAKNVRPT